MTRPVDRRAAATIAGCFLLLIAISVTPIQSFDYFWHLATGHWILDHGGIPTTDPFSVSSDRGVWIDGEWLFQVGAALVDRLSGTTGTSIARGVGVALVFTMGFVVMWRHAAPVTGLAVLAVSMWGADHRLTTRPETIATLLLVAGIWLLIELPTGWRQIAGYAALTLLWMAVHPSALLAPAIAGLVLVGRAVAGDGRRDLSRRAGVCVASAIALLVNPWGLEGVLGPFRLARLVGSGRFVNIEWSFTQPGKFPLVYIAAIVGIAAFIPRGRWRSEAPRLLIFGLLAALAIRYVRNHGFFFAAVPILVAPLLSFEPRNGARRVLAIVAALLLGGLVWRHGGIRVGVDPQQFPVASVSYLKGLALKGNIYNPDQLGGYLISRFYPERRVVTDGRNEIHVSYIEEYAKARLDQRAWEGLIRKYQLVIAVDEYHRETMEIVDAVTGEHRTLPSSLIYFPRTRWALIGFDDVAMVFVRRDAFDPALVEELEFRALVPDGAVPVVDTSPATLTRASQEVDKARDLFGSQRSIDRIAAMLGR